MIDFLLLFLKRVFRSSNIRQAGESHPPAENLNKALRLIKDVQKKYKTRTLEEKEREVRVVKLVCYQFLVQFCCLIGQLVDT